MLNTIFRGGGNDAPPHTVTKLVMLMLLLLVAPQSSYATSTNLNLFLNMVLTPQQTQINFGSSVAFWRTGGKMNLIVGAPRTPHEYKGTSYPLGNIFLCSLKGDCEQYNGLPNLIPNEIQALEFGKEYYKDMGIGLGETLSYKSLNESDSVLLVCSPRLPRYIEPRTKSDGTKNDPFFMSRGGCFKITDTDPKRITPFSRTGKEIKDDNFVRKEDGKNLFIRNAEGNTGYGLAGFSAALTKDETVFMGCPNTYSGEGSLSSYYYKNRRVEYKNYKFNKIKHNKQFPYTREGWAVTLGHFGSESDLDIIATSSPKENFNSGQIRFFEFNKLIKFNKLIDTSFNTLTPRNSLFTEDDISEHGFNSIYGYALASGDLDGDGNEELIVGAPLAEGRNKFREGGKVFIYYAPLSNKVSRKTQILKGPTAWLRFGSAVASDDFNHDGFYDVAVGAPYGENGWGGAVYIYMGSRDGLCERTGGTCYTPALLICASDFSPPGSGSSGLQYIHTSTSETCDKVSNSSLLLTLGYSLATADVDDNGYPDLLIGAPKADKSLLIRSAPVVELGGTIFFEPKNIQLGNKNCTATIGTEEVKVVCFKLKFNIHYAVHKLDMQSLSVAYKIKLDHKEGDKRIKFKHDGSTEYEWRGNIYESGSAKNISALEVYVKQGEINTNKEITASVTVKLKNNRPKSSKMTPTIPPVLYNPKHEFTARGFMQCKDDSTCFSKPNVKIIKPKSMKINVNGDSFHVDVNISIVEDYALGIDVYITHPTVVTPGARAEVKLMNILYPSKNINKHYEIDIINETSHKISIETFIKTDTTVSVGLTFKKYDPKALMSYLNKMGASKFDLNFNVTTEGEKDPSDNTAKLTIEALTDINLGVESFFIENNILVNNTKSTWSKSQIEEAFNNSKEISRDDLGPNIDYNIVINNKGPALMYQAKVIFALPLSIDEFPLFYVTEEPTAKGAPMNCTPIETNKMKFDFMTVDVDSDDEDDINDDDEDENDYNDDGNEDEGNQKESTESGEENDSGHERRKRTAGSKSSPFRASQGNESLTSKIDCSKTDCRSISKIDCSERNCPMISCSISSLAPSKTVTITLKNNRIIIASLLEFQPDASQYQLSGRMRVVTNQPGEGEQKEDWITSTAEITLAKETPPQGLKDIPWWWLLLAVLGGTLLILLFSYCLYKIGFFKRNRHHLASGKEAGSAEKIVGSNNEYMVRENTLLQRGIENDGSDGTPRNKRNERESDANFDTESTPLNERKDMDNDDGNV